MRILPMVAILSGLLSTVAWAYRFIDDFHPFEGILFYVLPPVVCWALFIGPVYMLQSERKWVKVIGGVLLVPFLPLWALSVLVGFYGLKIH